MLYSQRTEINVVVFFFLAVVSALPHQLRIISCTLNRGTLFTAL